MGRIRPIGPIGLILFCALVAAVSATDVAWDSIYQLTTNPSSQVTGYTGQRSVAVDGAGDVHVAWQDQRNVPYQIWYRRYDAGTSTWLAETTLTTQQANCSQPGMACDSAGNVHVAWYIGNWNPLGVGVWAKRHNVGTHHWRADTLIDSTSTSNPQQYPSVACVPGTGDVAVAWYGSPDTGMFAQVFLKERHPATGWDSAMQVSEASVIHDQVSVAAGRNGDLAVVWVGKDFGDDIYDQVYCRRRVEGEWQGVERVSDIPLAVRQYAPSIAFDPEGTVHAVWYGRTLNNAYFSVFHRMRGDGGWSGIDSFGGTPQYQQQYPSIACDGAGRCHTVWCSQAGGTNFQLAYCQRDTNGIWSTPRVLTGLDSGDVSHPSIACDADSGVHVVWYDASSGNQDVYYLHGAMPGTGVVDIHPARLVQSSAPRATVVRSGYLKPQPGMTLLDACGRSATGLATGVYFARVLDGSRFRRLVVVVR